MNFAEIVRSPKPVRIAFEHIPALGIWWRIVLALHGKPVQSTISPENKLKILIQGFRFYGYLYFGLGLVMACISVLLFMYDIFSLYWAALAAFSSIYLVASAQLAFKGAKLFAYHYAHGAVLLVCFFISITIFLSAFGAVASSTAYHQEYTSSLVNLSLYVLFVLFGIGSYFIEVVYLLWYSHDFIKNR